MNVDLDLLRQYNQSLPRYTSYPTAPHFGEAVGRETFRAEVWRANTAAPQAPLSLYLHLPFCRQLCYYCGCHMKVTHDPARIAKYLRYLKREIDLLAPMLSSDRPVTQVHWGGGTPTLLSPEQIRELGGHLRDRFRMAPDAEMSIEADPRGLTEDHIAAAREIGTNRLSLGVQSFDPTVQEAINRVQPERLTRTAVQWARDHGIESVNLDLVYGLPHQTPDTMADTLGGVVDLAPDRIALYSYAHVPSVLEHQRLIPEEALPAPTERLRLFKQALERLTTTAGYRFIGLDHFAKPDDELALAQDNGTLRRNFQGYSTRAGADVYAFGLSGIHQLSGLYAQNTKNLPTYYDQIDQDELTVYRGYRPTQEDRLRRHVIMRLMCNAEVQKGAVEARFNVDFDAHFSAALDRLRPLEQDGLVALGPDAITVRPPGRLLVRNVAAAFDAYLHDAAPDAQPAYSESV
ncbi:oxygen-independent coproporphyrinogen-3 oxidase [Salinibacter ruber]|uniref:Coproporphyrinogen-III oxidase n=1 Tax=Salinibacter ruber TaxID=146919 RepID=A0AAW5P358_9BACT|nr:oxygen-independent coproporphyrinogen III oxidase [Salinibacter ruber]MCS3663063.1 oxygen-independent coproporphyrinogen-3 oxidase [Salinibacter ruber]MCS4156407.1 oxygen-independent coproporphyrinogen-3 oxidase [Salinibacter ruber]MCS4176447.1 oxygen-independent coproporphyrinogen-3 oxidase [Salinibacter ruber]MCS4222759.1 oxygen-independent coproporphyrinogen-3 oxidase [Salinibacter ruber]